MVSIEITGGGLVDVIIVVAFIELQVALIVGYRFLRGVAAWLNAVGTKLNNLEKKASKVLPDEGGSAGGLGGMLGMLNNLGPLLGGGGK